LPRSRQIQVAASPEWAARVLDARRRLDDAREQKAGQYLNDPAGFVTGYLGEFLWSKQRQVMEAVRDHRLVAVRSCHGIGKSRVSSRIVCWWGTVHAPEDTRIVSTAPTFKQVRGVLWQEIKSAAPKLPGNVLQLEWQRDGLLVAQGIKPDDYSPDAFQGIHAKHLLVVLDEANGVSPALWQAAISLATSEHSRIIAIGNPDDPSGKFAEVCRPNSGWHTVQVGYMDTPNFSGEPVPEAISAKLISPAWLEDARRMYGEGSPLWTSKVLGEFPEQSEDSLIRLSSARAAVQREFEGEEFPNVLGVDVARMGSDKTVLVHRKGRTARFAGVHHHEDTMATAGRVIAALRETGAENAAIDADGLGAGVYDRLVEQGHPVQEMRGGFRARDHERFFNRRAEWYWGIRQRFEDGDIAIPDDEELLAQLTAIKYSLNSRGQIQLETKDEMRKRGMPSPDKADSLAYAFAAWDVPWSDVYGASSGEAPGAEAKPQPPNPWMSAYGPQQGG
jgi:hypothetical protein